MCVYKMLHMGSDIDVYMPVYVRVCVTVPYVYMLSQRKFFWRYHRPGLHRLMLLRGALVRPFEWSGSLSSKFHFPRHVFGENPHGFAHFLLF